MLLKELVKGTSVMLNSLQNEIEIKDIKTDINKINPGDLFLDLKGDKNLNKVFDKGCAFVIREGRSKGELKNVYSCSNIRENFALISKNFYNRACDKLRIIGITGTNGKTSTVRLVADILKFSGKKVGIIGTIGCEYLGNHIDTGFTTPDPQILHQLFFKMQKSGVEYVVMEVSAHAIALKKLEGITFEVLALTNITQDHLDFFGDMEKYANTKLSFFDKSHTKQGIICVDDPYARLLLGKTNIPVLTYGVDNPSDIFAIDKEISFDGTEFICNCLDEIFRARIKLVGDYNILNSLCAIGICSLLGIKINIIEKGISLSSPEIGRFNIINFNGINIVIDYAHTPDGLEKVLQNAKSLCPKRLIALFGCGGNRDVTKRPLMGSIAELYADKIFLTSDNPRNEDPFEIIKDIEKGMIGKNYEVEEDRKIAIQKALSYCCQGDCLIIAGKGGERYQDIKGEKKPYSDFDEVFKFFRKNLVLINERGRLKHGC